MSPCLAGIVAPEERFQKGPWQKDEVGCCGQTTACALPERCLRKVLLPKQLPAGNGSPVGAEQLGQFADATRRRSLPHGAYQHDHRKEIDLAAEETHRRRCHAFTATVARAAETETVVVVFGKIL